MQFLEEWFEPTVIVTILGAIILLVLTAISWTGIALEQIPPALVQIVLPPTQSKMIVALLIVAYIPILSLALPRISPVYDG
ncbi:hypothetical protein [Actibacterium sp. 188UL27-1]|uniref:hypothetical protein n=1 Tax=Actibacterium sp. 188UL27-1 TaxID=2786961 RepID=UPI00195C8DF1|nr:hypothetical protein [Actibacterium sp. 188UL27-1]MBM7069174.1 hypothetical protein [Actibacterium sp. 188UL27-1]